MKSLLRALCLVCCLLTLPAQAGTSLAGGKPNFSPEAILQFSKQVEQTLASKGARVALIARAGRPQSEMPEGMHFTHVSFAVYSNITLHDQRVVPGYAVYNLYQSDAEPDTSTLVQDYPVDFFAAVFSLESGVIIPSPELQKRLLEVITSPTYLR